MISYTALAAGVLGLLLALLGVRVSLLRLAGKFKEPGFERAQRVHGNAMEHVPLMLLLLFIAEYVKAPATLLLIAASTAIFARLAHAIGYSIRRQHPLQFTGATLTYVVEAGLAVVVIVYGVFRAA